MQFAAQLAQRAFQHRRVGGGQLADGVDAQPVQLVLHPPAHIEQRRGGHGPDQLAVVQPGDHRHGVGLFVVAAQLGEHLVEAHPHRDGQAGLLLDALAQQMSQGPGTGGKEGIAARNVQPAFVDAEGLHQIGILIVYCVDDFTIMQVFFAAGGQQYQVGAFAQGLPDGFGGGDAEDFGGLVFGQNDAVAGFGIAADGHGLVPQVGMVQQFHRGIKAVAVAVQHPAVHGTALLCAFFARK